MAAIDFPATPTNGQIFNAPNGIQYVFVSSPAPGFWRPNAVANNEIPQNSQSGASYAIVQADSGKHIYHPTGAAASTYTIPANATVAFNIGTCLTFVNDATTNVTIAITTDTLVLSPGGATGSRTLTQNGIATALKVGATRWLINGTGLS